MHVIRATNVNDAFRAGMRLVLTEGRRTESRNGPVLRVPEPVTTVYSLPWQRVLYDRTRFANPFFHLFEALWMLNGGNDLATLDLFIQRFRDFSDDGVTFHGAYGHRWRHWPTYTPTYIREIDQIARAIDILKKDPTSRRVVIAMWDPARDLAVDSKDIPCNDLIKLAIVDGRLEMIVFNRSNDVVWGCYGANAVQMSILHEYICTMIGNCRQGKLTQVSCDFHAYLEKPYDVNTFVPPDLWFVDDADNPYDSGLIVSEPLITNPATFDAELRSITDGLKNVGHIWHLDPKWYHNDFIRNVVFPMWFAWDRIRQKEHAEAAAILHECNTVTNCLNEWRQAGLDWIDEREKRRQRKPIAFAV